MNEATRPNPEGVRPPPATSDQTAEMPAEPTWGQQEKAPPGTIDHQLTPNPTCDDLVDRGADADGSGGVAKRRELPALPGYEIERVLGRGGMGIVYQARQTRLNRLVALKVVLAGAHAGPQQLARFEQEARAVARVQHPNIVQIYEIGGVDGLPYLSLEFVEGGSLEKYIDRKPQAPRFAAEIVETLARAMGFA